jgi:hypothetical protein
VAIGCPEDVKFLGMAPGTELLQGPKPKTKPKPKPRPNAKLLAFSSERMHKDYSSF